MKNKYCCFCGFLIETKEDAIYEVKINGLVHKRCYGENLIKITKKKVGNYE